MDQTQNVSGQKMRRARDGWPSAARWRVTAVSAAVRMLLPSTSHLTRWVMMIVMMTAVMMMMRMMMMMMQEMARLLQQG